MDRLTLVHRHGTGEEILLNLDTVVSARAIVAAEDSYTEIKLENGDTFEIVEGLDELARLSK